MVTCILMLYGRAPRMVSCASGAEPVFQQRLQTPFVVGLGNARGSGQEGDISERCLGQL